MILISISCTQSQKKPYSKINSAKVFAIMSSKIIKYLSRTSNNHKYYSLMLILLLFFRYIEHAMVNIPDLKCSWMPFYYSLLEKFVYRISKCWSISATGHLSKKVLLMIQFSHCSHGVAPTKRTTS